MKSTLSMGERVNATISGIKTVIYGRTAMILLGFLVQLALMCVGYILLRNYSYHRLIGVTCFMPFSCRSVPWRWCIFSMIQAIRT